MQVRTKRVVVAISMLFFMVIGSIGVLVASDKKVDKPIEQPMKYSAVTEYSYSVLYEGYRDGLGVQKSSLLILEGVSTDPRTGEKLTLTTKNAKNQESPGVSVPASILSPRIYAALEGKTRGTVVRIKFPPSDYETVQNLFNNKEQYKDGVFVDLKILSLSTADKNE